MLALLEPIKVIDCLTVGTTNRKGIVFELNEGATLSSTCLAFGNPPPYMQCSLVNNREQVVNGAITKREQRNFTASIRKRLRFHNVRRTASRVKCVLDGGPPARREVVQRNVIVDRRCLFVSS